MTAPSLAGKRKVEFSIKADQGCNVFVAGSFNEWGPKKNKLAFKNGTYKTTLMLSKGRHEYKYVIDDVWCVDPECPEWTPNGMGSLNSVINVA